MTLTKEQAELHAFITGFLSDSMHDDKSANSMTAKVFRMALAALTAEPVLYAAEETLAYAKMGEPLLKCLSQPTGHAVIPLYTAPPAPVSVPDGLRLALSNAGIAAPESDEMLAATCEKHIQTLVTWVKERKPFQPAPVVPETLPCPVMLEPGLRFGKGVRTQTMLDALQRRAEYSAELEAMTPEQRADHDAGMKEFAAMLQGAEPVQEWIPCSERMPETDGNYWGWWSESKRQGPVWFIKSDLQAQFQSSEITHWMPLPASPENT